MLRIVELFCGIGGVAEAARQIDKMSVVSALDIDQLSNEVYAVNHGLRPVCRTLESIEVLPAGDLIFLSPPCQPYTRRGRQRKESDPRSQALEHVIKLLKCDEANAIILENVPEFAGSEHHQQLAEVLRRRGFATCHQTLCPTQWGIPMRRRRFYLRAWKSSVPIPELRPSFAKLEFQSFLDPMAWNDSQLDVTETVYRQYAEAMDIIDLGRADSIAACFTSAYGSSPVRAGSYLRCPIKNRVRRFSCREVAALMGYREGFRWPSSVPNRRVYRMLGNALSVPVTRSLLESMIPSS